MREINLTAPALKRLTEDQLAGLYATAEDDALQTLVIAELDRRDRRARDRAARAAVNEEWFLFAHAQYLQAEAETCGYLLNKAGREADIDPFSLWSGPASRVEKYASDELRDFWLTHQRVTVTEYAARVRQSQREQRAAGLHDHCVKCGWDFGHWTAQATCGSARMCQKRQDLRNPAYGRRNGA